MQTRSFIPDMDFASMYSYALPRLSSAAGFSVRPAHEYESRHLFTDRTVVWRCQAPDADEMAEALRGFARGGGLQPVSFVMRDLWSVTVVKCRANSASAPGRPAVTFLELTSSSRGERLLASCSRCKEEALLKAAASGTLEGDIWEVEGDELVGGNIFEEGSVVTMDKLYTLVKRKAE